MLSIVAGVVAIAAYVKACGVESPSPPSVATTARDPALESALQRLEQRVAALERAAPPPTGIVPQPPADAVEAPQTIDTTAPDAATKPVEPAPARTENTEQHKKRVAATVEMYWRDWADRNHLDPKQTEALTALQMEASARRLDAQARQTSKEISQTASRAENVLVTEDVRRKARELLTPEQFAQFEADKGAETGSSYRAVRDALTKAAAAGNR
jgi:hypothetical protein